MYGVLNGGRVGKPASQLEPTSRVSLSRSRTTLYYGRTGMAYHSSVHSQCHWSAGPSVRQPTHPSSASSVCRTYSPAGLSVRQPTHLCSALSVCRTARLLRPCAALIQPPPATLAHHSVYPVRPTSRMACIACPHILCPPVDLPANPRTLTIPALSRSYPPAAFMVRQPALQSSPSAGSTHPLAFIARHPGSPARTPPARPTGSLARRPSLQLTRQPTHPSIQLVPAHGQPQQQLVLASYSDTALVMLCMPGAFVLLSSIPFSLLLSLTCCPLTPPSPAHQFSCRPAPVSTRPSSRPYTRLQSCIM